MHNRMGTKTKIDLRKENLFRVPREIDIKQYINKISENYYREGLTELLNYT